MLKRIYLGLPEAHRQFIAFCFVGGIGFLVDNGTLSLLVRVVGLNPILGRVISIVVAMTGSWLLNRTLTFRNRRDQPLWQEYLRFCLANGFGNGMNFLVYVVLVQNLDLFHRIPELGTVVGTAVGVGLNFTTTKYFVFRKH